MKQLRNRMTEIGLVAFTALALLAIVGIDTRASALPWYYGGDDGNTIYVAVGESIQDAIDLAGDGWTVELAPGEFPMAGPYGLNIYGKSLTLLGATYGGGEPASQRGSCVGQASWSFSSSQLWSSCCKDQRRS